MKKYILDIKCIECNKVFYSHVYKNKWSKYCSKKCRIRAWEKINPKKVLLNAARYRAKRRNIDFNLDLEDIKIPVYCPVLGIELKQHREGVRSGYYFDSPSIDRIDNNKGYLKDNILVISQKANLIKNNANSSDELRAVADYIDKFLQ